MQSESVILVWAALAVFVPLALGVSIPGVYRTWVDYRSRRQALDVLRVYAEKGQEPPASVTSAIGAFAGAGSAFVRSSPAPAAACSRPTRETHLAHVAGSVVCGLGAAWIAWWRVPDQGSPGALVIWAVVFAIFFAGSAAARLVGVFTTPSGRLRDGR
jgi:hypothetical protein